MDFFIRNTDSPVGKLDVRIKMAFGFLMSLVSIMVDSFATLGIAASVGLVFFMLSRPNISQIKLVTFSTLLIVWSMMISQGLFYNEFPRHVLIVLMKPNMFLKDGLKIYQQGIHHGLIQSFRLMAMFFTGYAICFSTEPDRFMAGLLAMRVPFSLSFMVVTAIRFLPVVTNEFRTVRTAMRLKGYRAFHSSIFHTVKTEIAGLRPVLAGTIRRSKEVALSILTRGFDIDGKRTTLYEEHFKPSHWIILAVMIIFVAGLMYCKIMFWLYQNEFCYSQELRPLYVFVRTWL